MTTPFKLAEESTQSLFNNMNKAIDNFVQTGKLKFGDFARSVILDLIAIQAKAAATQLLSFVLKDLFGFSLPGRAAGGPVSGGQAYIVGEQGPELFVPRASGTIVPNGQLGSGMGGGGAALATQVTYNINAVDAASFRQLVAREPEFLYAVTQKGRLSMPGGRR
jgi:phage-related minor tail protein